MAIRTINSPGIEITENDLSEYSSGDNGTHVLVAGFASKGENYTDTLVTTQRAFLANFGEPRNEAERYFYTACMEVLNQGGTLHACKLPYDNDSLDKCVAKTYTVNSPTTDILTVGQYMDEASNETVDFSDILIGDFSEFSNLPDYANIKTLQNIDNIYDTAIALSSANTERAQITTFSYAYLTDAELGLLNIAGSSEDNIRKESGENIYTRLSAMFSPTSTFRKKLAEGVISGTDGQPITSIDYAGVFDENGSVADNINKFKECVLNAFGGDDTTSIFENACNPETANASAIYAEFPNFDSTDLMKFIWANKRLFEQIKQIDAGTDASVFNKQLPYFYWDNSVSIFNVGVYYSAIKYIENKQSAQELYDSIDACKLANDVIDLRKVLTENTTINIDNINSFLSRITKLSGGDEYYTDSYTNLKTSFTNTAKTKLTTPLQDLLDGLESVKNNENFQNILDKTKFGTYVSTPFAKGVIDYYIHHTAISNAFHRRTIQKSTDLNIFLERKFSLTDVYDFSTGTSTLFELYTTYADDGTLINSIETLADAYLKTLNVTEFADLLDEFKTYDTYSLLTDYAEENNTEFNQSVIQHIDGEYAVTKLIFSDVHQLDNSITRTLNINSSSDVSLMDMSTIDAYATGEEEPTDGSFVIVDKTFNTLKRSSPKRS